MLPILAVVPGSDHGSFESFADAQYNLAHSARLCVFLALQVACVPVYNVLALQVRSIAWSLCSLCLGSFCVVVGCYNSVVCNRDGCGTCR